MRSSKSLLRLTSRFLATAFLILSPSVLLGQDIDVYFITGQSNAGNIGEQNGTLNDGSDVGFNLTYGRIMDQAADNNGSSAPDNVVDFYSSRSLNLNDEVNALAVLLNEGTGNDIAIFTFARNGRPLANTNSDDGESWFPGDGVTDFDAELYGQFQPWAAQRLADLATNNPASDVNVNGVFWFQGEGDVGIGQTAVDAYETNFGNLVDRFSDDFGDDVAVVAANLRIVTNSTQQALNDGVNGAIANVAAGDESVGFVNTTVNEDGTGGPLDDRFGNFNTDPHFSDAAQTTIVQRWAAESLRIQAATSVPEPSTFGISFFALAACGLRRRRNG